MGDDVLKKDGRLFRQHVIDKYLTNTHVCPFCGKETAESGGDEQVDDSTISWLINCSSCKKKWWEVYKLTTIEPQWEG